MIKSRKQVSLALCMLMAVSVFSGCGKKGSNSNTSAEADYDHIYRETEFTLSEDVDTEGLYNMFAFGDRIIAYGSVYNDASDYSDYVVLSFKNDGSDVKQITINGKPKEGEGSIYVSDVKTDLDGNLYLIKDEYIYDEDSESSDIYYLAKYSPEGEALWEVSVSDYSNGGKYYSDIIYLESRGLILSGDNYIALYSSEDGSLIKEYDVGVDYLREIIPHDDDLYLYYWEDEGYILKEYSLDDGKWGEEVDIPSSLSVYNSCVPGTSTDLLLLSSSGIYTYNFGDEDVTYTCSYIDSDINPDSVEGVAQLSDEEYLLLVRDEEDYSYKFKKIVKVPADEAKSQEIITLGCYWLDSTVRREVINFNKTNTKYRISVKDYSLYDTDSDYNAGITKLNTDIVGGNVPDIILASSEMPMESYVAKDLFMDLDKLIESDSDFVSDDYLQNIFDSFRRDGKLYSIVPGFSIYTVAAATSDLNGKTSWTMNDMKQIADSLNIAYKDMFGPGYSRDDIMNMAIFLNASSYIDWDKHECYFDTDEFKEFLSFMKEFPEEIDYSIYSNDYSDYWRKDKALAYLTYMGSFYEYKYALRGTFGEDVTMVGFPTSGASGSIIIPSNEMCISASTDKADGCWEFLKSFLTDECQEGIAEYGYFPVKKSTFEKMADDAMKPSTWTNEDGTVETYTESTSIGGKEVELTPLTQEERDYAVSFVESITEHLSYNEEILNIISEEAAAYFSDQKTVDDVASIIQNRVNIYVNENS